VDVSSLGIPTYEEYMREYCERMNIPLIENWNVYMAFTLFRVAAILQGVYKRSLKGLFSYDSLYSSYYLLII
jgi:acyl-CoA dehydrogenase family protein 10